MAVNHTPGPWDCAWDACGPYWIVGPTGNPVTYLDGEPGEREPDARLIAAAPEMLEALKAALPKVIAHTKMNCQNDCELCRLRSKMKSVIQKAEGKTRG